MLRRLSGATSKEILTNEQKLLEAGCFYTIYSSRYNIKSHRRRQIIEECARKTGKCLDNHMIHSAAEVFSELCVLLLLETSVVALYCNI